MNKIQIIKCEKTHLVYIVKWLNQRPINGILRDRHMTNIRQQELWFDEISQSNTRRFFVFINEGELVGFGGLEGIDWPSRKAEAFVILDKQSGVVTELNALNAIAEFAFNEICINRVSADILSKKAALIKDLEKLGFVKESRKRQHYFCDKSYHHVIEMAVLASEFKNERSKYTVNSD